MLYKLVLAKAFLCKNPTPALHNVVNQTKDLHVYSEHETRMKQAGTMMQLVEKNFGSALAINFTLLHHELPGVRFTERVSRAVR